MVLPDNVSLCDAVELAAINHHKPLFEKDLTKQFFPAQTPADVEAEVKDMFALANDRYAAIPNIYPFKVTDKSIEYIPTTDFNIYNFLLLGRSLDFGGPANQPSLLKGFRRYFEDIVGWSLKKAGFAVEVLSEPRGYRGLDAQLPRALRKISDRFREKANLDEGKLVPHDNDLDVDVLAVPVVGNATRGGWPFFQIQCATGAVGNIESKLGEGACNFTSVWESGFYQGGCIRAVATPDDLLNLNKVYWDRLGRTGWILDRTRIAHLAANNRPIPLLNEVANYWNDLWAARSDIAWQTGWQKY